MRHTWARSEIKHNLVRVISRHNLHDHVEKMFEEDRDTATLTSPDIMDARAALLEGKKYSFSVKMNPLDRRNSHDGVTFDSPELLQLNELREAKIRAIQMEKTMRWWSDCSSNWRDKWGQVKNERNKAREDIKVLKQKLDDANQVIYQLKRERNEFKEGNSQLRKDVDKMAAELKRDRRAFVQPMRIADNSNTNAANAFKTQPDPTDVPRDEKASQGSNTMQSFITDADAFVEITKAHDKKIETEQSFNSVHEQHEKPNDGDKRTKDVDGALNEMKKELDSLKEKLGNTENQVTEETR